MFYLRDIDDADLDGLHAVAGHLDTVNLPDDRPVLAGLVAASQKSFAGQIDVFKRAAEFAGWPEGHSNIVLCKTLAAR